MDCIEFKKKVKVIFFFKLRQWLMKTEDLKSIDYPVIKKNSDCSIQC